MGIRIQEHRSYIERGYRCEMEIGMLWWKGSLLVDESELCFR